LRLGTTTADPRADLREVIHIDSMDFLNFIATIGTEPRNDRDADLGNLPHVRIEAVAA
jgi:hypothetical protein